MKSEKARELIEKYAIGNSRNEASYLLKRTAIRCVELAEQEDVLGNVIPATHNLYDLLHRLKFDYRGLIDAKLAVSVHDLPTNPYE